jgi:hypothetical protein
MRNIQRDEQEVLVREKLRKGETEEQAKLEVKRDVEFINTLKQEASKKKQEIYELKKQKEELDNQWKKTFENLIKAKEREKTKVVTNNLYPTTLHLNRVLFYLSENKDKTQSDIADNCCMTGEYVKKALIFLNEHKLITKLTIRNERKILVDRYNSNENCN